MGYFIHVERSHVDPKALASLTFDFAFRCTLDKPGFALINLGSAIDSHDLRQLMVQLKNHLAALHFQRSGQLWHYLSMGRFNQQVTTKFHLDGAPEESMLMLGYEPSPIESQLYLADYTKCAYDLGITPRKFLDDLNPMFTQGAKSLENYVTRLEEWRSMDAQILLINNSSAAYERNGQKLLGVMHKAEITRPEPSKNRIVNSTMMYSAKEGAIEPVSSEEQKRFVETTEISGKSYT